MSSAEQIGRSPNGHLAAAGRRPLPDLYDLVQGRENQAVICRCQKTGIGGKSADHRTIVTLLCRGLYITLRLLVSQKLSSFLVALIIVCYFVPNPTFSAPNLHLNERGITECHRSARCKNKEGGYSCSCLRHLTKQNGSCILDSKY